MAIVLLADENIEGQVARLADEMCGDYWRQYWDDLKLCTVRFADVGLAKGSPDSVLWHECQRQELYLLTDNRNGDGPDSLEATIRHHNKPDSLPIFTFSDSKKILQSRSYLDRVVESLYDQLLRLDTLKGTGRLFLPYFPSSSQNKQPCESGHSEAHPRACWPCPPFSQRLYLAPLGELSSR
jgi:hypothetical protein